MLIIELGNCVKLRVLSYKFEFVIDPRTLKQAHAHCNDPTPVQVIYTALKNIHFYFRTMLGINNHN